MYKLLKAGLSRMLKNKAFMIIIIITVVLAIFFVLNNMSNLSASKSDGLLYSYTLIIGIFIAMFTSLFVGTEYSYGTIKNKIIVGHSRINIYISNLIFSIIGGIIMQIVYIAIVIVLGGLIIGNVEMSFSNFFILFIEMFAIIVAYSSIFNLITLACPDMTVATIICMLLFLVMYIVTSSLTSIINAPEYITHTLTDDSGNIQVISEEPNPNYPGKVKMIISKLLYYIIPTGSAMQMAGNIDNIDVVLSLSYLVTIIILSNVFGICIFNRKDLK